MVRTLLAGVAQLARASAFQAEGRGFESRFPLVSAQVAQLAEHVLGKDEVGGSIPLLGSQSFEENNRLNGEGEI